VVAPFEPADVKADSPWLEQSEVPVADIKLTQADADVLLAMEKHKVEDIPYEYPSLGGGVRIPLQSSDKRELFFLDITRSQVVLTKGTYQNPARGVAIPPAPVSRRVRRSMGDSMSDMVPTGERLGHHLSSALSDGAK
jgi:hypothetical protein